MVPKVSVIVPVYNVAAYMERCVRSLFEQTLFDIEYIFVDDCSPDNSIEILRNVVAEYPERQKQMHILKNAKNSGLAFTRKAGISKATGDYIIHCDSDDWVAPTMYEKLYNFAVNGGFDMVWCDYYRSNGIAHSVIRQPCSTDQLSLVSAYLTSPSSRLIGSVCNRLYKRRLQQDDKFIAPKANMTEDFVITLQITLNSKKIGYLPEPLYYYYVNEQSICMNPNEESIVRNLYGIVENNELILHILQSHGLTDKLSKQIDCKKFTCKEILIPVLSKPRYRQLWRETYLEVNNRILSNPYIPLNSKIRAFCLLNGLYYLYAGLRNARK